MNEIKEVTKLGVEWKGVDDYSIIDSSNDADYLSIDLVKKMQEAIIYNVFKIPAHTVYPALYEKDEDGNYHEIV